MLSAMSESAQWKAVVKKNGWNPFFKSGTKLTEFLILHEKNLKVTMQELKIM